MNINLFEDLPYENELKIAKTLVKQDYQKK